ncbi:hypothetical protein C8Q77DRAFT_1153053 [Trametes polyzona]|nr:hypothetical protein C8Q77DRAFT_1153053 [Trametes polyzona]
MTSPLSVRSRPSSVPTLNNPLLRLIWIWCTAVLASGILVNRTIDDELGDSVSHAPPVYLPDGGWALGSVCTSCNIHPGLADVDQAFDQTWHDTTHHPGSASPSIIATFSGSAVYVFNLVANFVRDTTTLTNLTFALDGVLVGQYVHAPDPKGAQILYNVLVYSNTSLSDGLHTLVISPSDDVASLILFDYIVYTVDQETRTTATAPSSAEATTATATPTGTQRSLPSGVSQGTSISPSRSLPLGPIIGGAIAGVVVLAILIAAGVFFYLRRRRRRIQVSSRPAMNQEQTSNDVPPAPSMQERHAADAPVVPPERSHRTGTTGNTLVSPTTPSRSVAVHTATMPSPSPPTSLSAIYAARSRRHADLSERITLLESQIGDPRPALSLGGSVATSTTARSGWSRSTEASEQRRLLDRELRALRSEIAEVRAMLEHERELSNEMRRM